MKKFIFPDSWKKKAGDSPITENFLQFTVCEYSGLFMGSRWVSLGNFLIWENNIKTGDQNQS